MIQRVQKSTGGSLRKMGVKKRQVGPPYYTTTRHDPPDPVFDKMRDMLLLRVFFDKMRDMLGFGPKLENVESHTPSQHYGTLKPTTTFNTINRLKARKPIISNKQ